MAHALAHQKFIWISFCALSISLSLVFVLSLDFWKKVILILRWTAQWLLFNRAPVYCSEKLSTRDNEFKLSQRWTVATDKFYYRWKMHEPSEIDFLVWFFFNLLKVNIEHARISNEPKYLLIAVAFPPILIITFWITKKIKKKMFGMPSTCMKVVENKNRTSKKHSSVYLRFGAEKKTWFVQTVRCFLSVVNCT